MKSVLRSIKPYWVYLIITGKKTIEVGKNFPKDKNWDKTVEVYCSKDKQSFNRIPEKDREWMRKYLGKVACRFICDEIIVVDCDSCSIFDRKTGNHIEKETCISRDEAWKYLFPNCGYGWHISDLKIYDKPKKLGEFRKKCISVPTATCYPDNCKRCVWNTIIRPPQSWFYVEE